MSKKDLTYVDREKLVTIVASKGVKMTDNAGFTKCELGNDYNLYVPTTKTVGRVDFQFEAPEGLAGVTKLGARSFGRIVAQLDFAKERKEEEILATFKAMLEHGLALPKWERPKRTQPGTVKAAKAGKKDETPESKEAAKKAREELIRKVAKEKGVKISEKAGVGA